MPESKKYRVRFGMPDGKPLTVPVRAASSSEARAKGLDRLCEGSTHIAPVPSALLAGRKPGELGKRWPCPFCGSRHFKVERVNWGLAYDCANCEQGLLWPMPPPGTFDPTRYNLEGDGIVFADRTGWIAVPEPWKRVFDGRGESLLARRPRQLFMSEAEFDDMMAAGLPRGTDEATVKRVRSMMLRDHVVITAAD